jgi:putative DNA primase/helicase
VAEVIEIKEEKPKKPRKSKAKKSAPAEEKDTPAETEAQRASLEPDPFRCLGYLSGIYHYYSRGEQAVVSLASGSHGQKSLYRLAKHAHWVAHYPVTKVNDFDDNAAASALMASCQKAGIFNIHRIRGRGVWLDRSDDKASLIIHYGDKVTIDGKEYLPYLTPGKYVYELAEALGFPECDPLSDERSKIFPDLIKDLKWETPEQAIWFTGWLVCALIGGALPWRPHIWLTGGAQSGKSTLSAIIKKILRNNCLYVKSVSTEAGIRQTLKADCISVVMDEAEREDSTSHSRIQSILTLARQASSDDDSRIVKGTPTGTALNFQIRSPFCLSSINSALVQTADKTRFANLELLSAKLSGDDYILWKEKIDALLVQKWVQSLYQRIFSMVPVIVKNALTFARAIEAKTGDRRLGDQYGALLAGHKSLYEIKEYSRDDAKWMIDVIDFNLEKETANGINDQHSLLNKIMQHVMRVPKDKGFEELSIAEMCDRVHRNRDTYGECKSLLGNIGIKVIENYIAIANDNDNLAEILKGSRWPHNWQQTLKRLKFATPSAKPIYFSPGCKPRATILPVGEVIFEEEETKPETARLV